ncbi:MAG: hypothetical protein J0I09_10460 [Sphingobacteriia bacterium]|nr:hypothetical protein [Sphingobacteriia bacterium]
MNTQIQNSALQENFFSNSEKQQAKEKICVGLHANFYYRGRILAGFNTPISRDKVDQELQKQNYKSNSQKNELKNTLYSKIFQQLMHPDSPVNPKDFLGLVLNYLITNDSVINQLESFPEENLSFKMDVFEDGENKTTINNIEFSDWVDLHKNAIVDKKRLDENLHEIIRKSKVIKLDKFGFLDTRVKYANKKVKVQLNIFFSDEVLNTYEFDETVEKGIEIINSIQSAKVDLDAFKMEKGNHLFELIEKGIPNQEEFRLTALQFLVAHNASKNAFKYYPNQSHGFMMIINKEFLLDVSIYHVDYSVLKQMKELKS